MRIALIPVLVLCGGLALAAPPDVPERPDPVVRIESLLDPRILLLGVVREEDVSLLLAQIRAVLLAAYEGREPPPADELNRRMESIGGELRSRGLLAGMVLLATFEAAARQALREALAAPAPAPR